MPQLQSYIDMTICLIEMLIIIPNLKKNITFAEKISGMWRSWLACWSGGPEAVSSSLTIPTKKILN